jgi:hypothetical protein
LNHIIYHKIDNLINLLLILIFLAFSIARPKNDYGIGERIALITKQIQEWHAKWQLAQKRGISICSSIENLIKSILSSKSKDESTVGLNPDLIKLCENLRIIITVFEDLISNFQKACDQLESSLKLPNTNKGTIYGRTWSLANLIDFLEKVLHLYRKEYEIKLKVMGWFIILNCMKKNIKFNYFFRKYCTFFIN